MKQLFIAWVPFQRRSLSIQSHLQCNLEFIKLSFKKRFLRPVEYVFKILKTVFLLFTYKPQIVWLQLPPTLLLHITFLYKTLIQKDLYIIADCHNATFRKPWIKIPLTLQLLNQSDAIVVHNEWIREQAISLGLQARKTIVLEDPPAELKHQSSLKSDQLLLNQALNHPWVLFPCSFNQDEPIETVFKAASLAPDITFILTGNSNRAKGVHNLEKIPSNVKLVGFLKEETFNDCLFETDAILGLTTLEGVQLSVASEALGAGKAMVLSHTKTLQQMFYKGAVYVDPHDPHSIAQGCYTALADQVELCKQSRELHDEKQKDWLVKFSSILEVITKSA